ncbi:uncharacterized protein BKA55DRAFT_527173, partial [Fusarium redolens]
RSLQAPRPNKPYLTKGHNIIPKIKEALRQNKGKGNILYIIAIDIKEAWFNKDNTSRIKIVIFSYKIFLLI